MVHNSCWFVSQCISEAGLPPQSNILTWRVMTKNKSVKNWNSIQLCCVTFSYHKCNLFLSKVLTFMNEALASLENSPTLISGESKWKLHLLWIILPLWTVFETSRLDPKLTRRLTFKFIPFCGKWRARQEQRQLQMSSRRVWSWWRCVGLWRGRRRPPLGSDRVVDKLATSTWRWEGQRWLFSLAVHFRHLIDRGGRGPSEGLVRVWTHPLYSGA